MNILVFDIETIPDIDGCRRIYDLHGLSEARCPECGTAFDPTERERILARIHSPPPKPRYRWIAALVVVLLSLAVTGSLVLYRQASKTAAKRAAAPTAQPSPPTSQSEK